MYECKKINTFHLHVTYARESRNFFREWGGLGLRGTFISPGVGSKTLFLVTLLCELKKVLNFPGGPNPLDPLQISA